MTLEPETIPAPSTAWPNSDQIALARRMQHLQWLTGPEREAVDAAADGVPGNVETLRRIEVSHGRELLEIP